MDLLCYELSEGENCRTYQDPVILNDDRVLENLLKTEDRYMASVSLFQCVQHDISADMRKIVAEWMLEVCEEEKCQEDVFPLSINYMDRFLSVCPIRKGHFQILGSTCLLLASKIREPKPISVDMLVLYTDYSITNSDLLKWELFVLSKLKWDLSAITPNDFINPIINRLPKSIADLIDIPMISRHVKTFIAFSAKEFSFAAYSPSLITSASIAAALYGLGWKNNNDHAEKSLSVLLKSLQAITMAEHDYIYDCLMKIEELISKTINDRLNSNFEQGNANFGSTSTSTTTLSVDNGGSLDQFSACKTMKSQTPTDVNDIYF